MKLHLKDLVNISTGIYEKPVAEGEVYYIQARHFDANRNWLESIPPDLQYNPKLEKHFLKPGDVLLAAKGNNFFASVYSGKFKPAVASSFFMVLKPGKAILPEFLVSFLNHPRTQRLLLDAAKGTSLASLTIGDVLSLNLNLPNLEKQKKIMAYWTLEVTRKRIVSQIENLQKTIFNHHLAQLFNS